MAFHPKPSFEEASLGWIVDKILSAVGKRIMGSKELSKRFINSRHSAPCMTPPLTLLSDTIFVVADIFNLQTSQVRSLPTQIDRNRC